MAMVRHLSGAMAMEPSTGGYLRCQPAWRLTESLRPMGPGLSSSEFEPPAHGDREKHAQRGMVGRQATRI